MSVNDISVEIDRENDVVYIIRKDADSVNTRNVSVDADTLFRFDDKEKIVGITIERFSEVFPDLKDCKEYPLMEIFERILDYLNASHRLVTA